MSVRTVMLLAAALTHQLHAQPHAQVHDPEKEKSEDAQLHYVVALIKDVLYCYGTLISPNWVLTAASCFAATSVQYGDLSIPLNETTSVRKILFSERPRSSKILEPDLSMVFISSVPLGYFGQLSAVDYKAIAGHVITYTDFLASQNDIIKEGIVSPCNMEKQSAFSSHLCVAPKCSDKQQLSLPGEPGSPLFHAGKLVGVHVGDSTLQSLGDTKLYFLRTYTPISPFLSWINEVIRTREFTTFP